ncbi:MAG: BLUF domain-containing protein [Alphaproteobacteria bacterium]|nr:BLUF domain-containing protein [Alphaproteobacteria bacterium]
MLVRLLYASRADGPVASSTLDAILAQCRQNNPALGVTGLLVVADEVFMQVLEGGREEVCELYNQIVRDERHKQVRILTFEEISERKFGAWTMGQVQGGRINRALILKYFKRPEIDPFDMSGGATMSLLLDLVATASIVSRPD